MELKWQCKVTTNITYWRPSWFWSAAAGQVMLVVESLIAQSKWQCNMDSMLAQAGAAGSNSTTKPVLAQSSAVADLGKRQTTADSKPVWRCH